MVAFRQRNGRQERTKEQLLNELREIGQRIAELEALKLDSDLMYRAIEHGSITIIKEPFNRDDMLNAVRSFT